MTSDDRPEKKRLGLMSASRLVEMIVVALVSSAVSGGIVGYGTLRVLEVEIQYLRTSLAETRAEIKELRRDLYRPHTWPGESERGMEIDFATLRDDLSQSLHAAARKFSGPDSDPDQDFRRHIFIAASDLAVRRGRTLVGDVELQADVKEYTAPADLLFVKSTLWGQDHKILPWDDKYPGPLPRCWVLRAPGAVTLRLNPPPTARQLQALSASYKFFYAAAYWTGDASDPIILDRADDRDLLLLRAQAEAARELTMQNIAWPGETKIKLASSRNMTSRALFDALMAEFDRRTGAGVAA